MKLFKKLGQKLEKAAKPLEKAVMPVVRKVKGVILKYYPLTSVSRNATLLLIKINFAGIAAALKKARDNKGHWDKLTLFWRDIGGNPNKLSTAITEGYKVDLKHRKNFDGAEEYPDLIEYDFDTYDGEGVPDSAEPVTTSGAAATAVPVITKILALLKNMGITPDSVINAMSKKVNDKADEGLLQLSEGEEIVTDGQTGEKTVMIKRQLPIPVTDGGGMNLILPVGGALLVLLLLLKKKA